MSSFSLIFALGLSCFFNSTSRLATESTHILIELNQVPPFFFFNLSGKKEGYIGFLQCL